MRPRSYGGFLCPTDFNPRTPCGVRPSGSASLKNPCRYFNPRTPCGVRPEPVSLTRGNGIFQSTHPLRGATRRGALHGGDSKDFNPRTPCGVRRGRTCKTPASVKFQSTHPLRGATVFGNRVEQRRKFQSTHPLRGATYICVWSTRLPVISIHAPLAGCDFVSPSSAARSSYISIHAPLAGCDDQHYTIDRLVDISIHAPLAGCDENY